MATLALAVAGSAVGGAVLPAGLSVLGASISGAALGAQIGAFAGSYVDHALFGASGQTRTVEGPRLSNVHMTGSTEGAAIPRLYGRARLGGQVIWADAIKERVIRTTTGEGSAKGAGAASTGPATTTIEYRYSASFAVALCEGTISGLGQVWADGREINLSRLTYRLHKGNETQTPDTLISARLGAANAPAFRGTAYVLFENLQLAAFGNRIPQLSFEVYRAIEAFGEEVKGAVLIPGSGEFVYSPTPVSETLGDGRALTENVHTRQAATDWAASLQQFEQTLPNAKSVSLIVSWFGDDLRAGQCQLKPGVDRVTKVTEPLTWGVSGITRAAAHVISLKDGRPAYGGTPSDQTVVSAIVDLKARGLDVVMTPFILMDVADGNTLANPLDGSASQPSYPWRGRISVTPGPGLVGTVDKTAAAATQIAAFVGTAAVSHFSLSGTNVVYTGPIEWSYRRMVLHQAHLAKAAGGVTAFVIGTELRGLTQARSSASAYPFVAALVQLAQDVKGVLGAGTKVTYAADWSEYFGHQPGDGTGDVYFHLDPLWSSASIDAIGVDVYWPLADWRDGSTHLDYLAGTRSTYDLSYLRANVQGGEGYDWYYASDANRTAQVRTPITDGAGKPWVFRFKDIKSWWQNAHYNRPLGIESGTPTAWVPQSKPFWFMETGCPCVDKGANQPNVFVDPKSAESALPYFSRATRDDLIQRRYLRALIQAFDPASDGYLAGANPVSTVTSQRMADLARIHVYCWDARPFPAFPYSTDVWGDGENWRLGHWLNGRFAGAPLAETVQAILQDYGFADYETGALTGIVTGYVIDRIMAARDALQPLELSYFFDSLESTGRIVFRQRGAEPAVAHVLDDNLVERQPGAELRTLTRGQETELPASAKITYISSAGDYRQAVAEARRLTGASGRVSQAEVPIVFEPERGSAIAETWLFEAWSARERAQFTLPPSALGVEPGDIVELINAGGRLVRITDIGDHGARECEGRSIDPDVYGGAPAVARNGPSGPAEAAGQPLVEFLDLPLLRGDEAPEDGYVAAFQSPWPGGVAVYGSPETTGYVLKAIAGSPAIVGVTLDALGPGPLGVVDYGNTVRVELADGELASVSRLQMLAGQNLAAVRNADGAWEVFQFETATLVAANTYQLSGLLRGQAGTDGAMRSPVAAGARFVLLTSDVATVDLTLDDRNLPLNWRSGPANRDIGDLSYATRSFTFKAAGLRPLSPAQLRAARTVGNDVVLSWVRRTRIGGDSWEPAEVPLAEDSERYEVDIMSGATVKRTIAATVPGVTYTQAQQVLDFGSVQPSYAVNIYQLSTLYGRGSAKSASV